LHQNSGGFDQIAKLRYPFTNGQVIAFDGKVLRHSHDKYLGKKAISMVSAWATANELVLGQMKVDDKSNEITVIPKLLQVLEISGCIITIDALGCQKAIASEIVSQGADYVLALKENQGNLHEDVELLFDDLEGSRYAAYAHDYVQTVLLLRHIAASPRPRIDSRMERNTDRGERQTIRVPLYP